MALPDGRITLQVQVRYSAPCSESALRQWALHGQHSFCLLAPYWPMEQRTGKQPVATVSDLFLVPKSWGGPLGRDLPLCLYIDVQFLHKLINTRQHNLNFSRGSC